ncbi:MAG TPA: hypothetical protein VKH43_08260 [Thermoanaerobaculia bacterium]|nr:hypothetical protein [Thermoanaerobaculia bacterium]
MKPSAVCRFLPVISCVLASVIFGGASGLLATCGPFTDTANDAFCPFVLEIFYLGITTGTSPTTYDPMGNVSRLQEAAFLSRTVDTVLSRGSRRAALSQFWTSQTQGASSLGATTLSLSHGIHFWVTWQNFGRLLRI